MTTATSYTDTPNRLAFIAFPPGRAVIDVYGRDAVSTFEASLPAAGWATLARAILSRWARSGAELAFEPRQARGHRQIRLSDGEVSLLLDLRD